jgi:hypothetical protein
MGTSQEQHLAGCTLDRHVSNACWYRMQWSTRACAGSCKARLPAAGNVLAVLLELQTPVVLSLTVMLNSRLMIRDSPAMMQQQQ